MSKHNDETFRPKLGRPKASGRGRVRFISRVLKASARAGHPIGHNLRSACARPGAKLGRGHVAARLVGQRLGPRARRVVIKTRLVVAKRSNPRATQRHLRYIQRDGVTREGGPGEVYGPATDHEDAAAFEERGQADRHQFRFILSPEDAVELADLKAFNRQLMAEVERDLGTRLDWVAVDHWDTAHPHTHIVLRGADEEGRDLIIAREYIARGMRLRASELATEWLGERTEREIRAARNREVTQERWTSLDREIQGFAREGVMDLRLDALDVEGRTRRALHIGRLDRLVDMGLAKKTEAGVWHLDAEAESTLRTMGERGDIIRTMQRAFTQEQREYAIVNPSRLSAPIVGRIAFKGLADELYDRGYVVVDGVDGRAHYVPLARSVDIADLPMEGIVEVRGAAKARAADRTIAALADGGIYKTATHLAHARSDSHGHDDPEGFVEAHVRRLEALRRARIAERITEGVWKVPNDLLERGRRYDAERADGALVELRSHLSVKQQVRAIGATWLDRQLLFGSKSLALQGFGAQVREALRAREVFLVEHGLAERHGERVNLGQNLLATLRWRELQKTATAISSETGLAYRAASDGERVTGVYRRSLNLVSGRFAMLDDGIGFTLVPWRPVIEPRLGQSISASIRGHSVSWDLSRGLSPLHA
jgi:type IV secretory pathway VirD2 relaxase